MEELHELDSDYYKKTCINHRSSTISCKVKRAAENTYSLLRSKITRDYSVNGCQSITFTSITTILHFSINCRNLKVRPTCVTLRNMDKTSSTVWTRLRERM